MRSQIASLKQRIEPLCHAVSIFHVHATPKTDDHVEIHAVLLQDPDQQYISRCGGGIDDQHEYAAMRELATMVGIEP
jgi:hypothetical protein